MPYLDIWIFGYLGAKMHTKMLSGWNLKTILSYLKSAKICLIIKFRIKIKKPKFGTKNALFWYFWTKMAYLGIFGLEFYKYYCHIWNQHPQICLIAKFCEKEKIPKFGTKNALFGYFWARILKNYCHIWNQHPQIGQKWVFDS